MHTVRPETRTVPELPSAEQPCLSQALLTPGRNERVQAQQTPPAVAPQQEVATPTPDSKKLSTHGTPAAPPTASPLGLAAFLAEVT